MALYRYIQGKKETFEQSPVNPLDVLAFTWLTYFDFSTLEERLPIAIKDLLGTPFEKNLEKSHQSWVPRISAKLFRAMMRSPRYQDAVILRAVENFSGEDVYQFGAVAIQAGGKTIVAYEGTDLSPTGWREDCVMSYSDEIGSYPVGEGFLQEVMDATSGPIIVSGHSKGGNIAVYVAAKIKDGSRIERVYSYDGPGFHNSNIFEEHPERESWVTKYIPQGSIVGVLLNSNAKTTIVRSYSIGVFQHNAVKWTIDGDDFKRVDKLSLSSRFLDRAANQWINGLTDEEKKRFVGLFFGGTSDQARPRLSNILQEFAKAVPGVALAYGMMTKDDRKFMFRVMKRLASSVYQTGRESMGLENTALPEKSSETDE